MMNQATPLSLSRFETLPFYGTEKPSISMLRSTRMYGIQNEDIPAAEVTPEALRDLYSLVVGKPCKAFISEECVFVTQKNPFCPADMKEVAVDGLFTSYGVEVVRAGLTEYLLNEVIPKVSPCDATRWSFEFLCEFDRLLSIPVKNPGTTFMETYNFRNLRHRICTKRLTDGEIALVDAAFPQYRDLLNLFQT